MNPEFEKHKKKLESAFAPQSLASPKYLDYTLFIKGDVSGIQDFIFSVKSDGAAKSLKGRSHFIEAATAIVVHKFQQDFKTDFELLYNGGGNFYGLLKNIPPIDVQKVQAELEKDLLGQDFYFSLTSIEVKPNDYHAFGRCWAALHVEASKDKLQRFSKLNATALFNPYQKSKMPFAPKEFTQELVDAKGVEIVAPIGKRPFEAIDFADYRYQLTNSNTAFGGKITNKLPKEKNKDIRDFSTLAHLASGRTGTEKLAVLKYDVDNLGAAFQSIVEIEKTVELSKALAWFFESYLYELWQNTEGGKFAENLYVVFSGGDDGFIVGAWDYVFEFTQLIRKEFHAFAGQFNLTLSAALLLIDEHFPVVRFAHLAEDELKRAKKTKPAVAVFGEILTWEDFTQAQDVALKLKDFVENKGESRTILDRIKRSRSGFEKLQNTAFTEGVLRGRALWRLQYYLRSSKNKLALEKLIIEPYQRALLLGSISQNTKPMNPALFPVAARWAEFLTRKKGTQ